MKAFSSSVDQAMDDVCGQLLKHKNFNVETWLVEDWELCHAIARSW